MIHLNFFSYLNIKELIHEHNIWRKFFVSSLTVNEEQNLSWPLTSAKTTAFQLNIFSRKNSDTLHTFSENQKQVEKSKWCKHFRYVHEYKIAIILNMNNTIDD